jgi:class 3 adenylate cyclase
MGALFSRDKYMEYYFFKSLALIFKLVKWFFIAIIFITIIGILSSYMQDISHFTYIQYILSTDRQINVFIHEHIPTHFAGRDISHWVTLLLAFIFMSISSNFEFTMDYKARFNKVTTDTKKLEKLRKTDQGVEKLAILDEKMQKIQTASRKDREALLKEFIIIKKQLETMGRDLAFLSVDIVSSTEMKKKEDPIVVGYDFAEYRKFAEGKLNAYGCIKSTWTPDGLMACFNTVEEAVKTAQAMINGLKDFNKSVKTMKGNFAIRCGVNAGYLLFDDTLPLEEISDRVIDIAGHMQKNARPNTIFLAKNIIMPIESPDKFSSISQIVDDLDVCEWQPQGIPPSNNNARKS